MIFFIYLLAVGLVPTFISAVPATPTKVVDDQTAFFDPYLNKKTEATVPDVQVPQLPEGAHKSGIQSMVRIGQGVMVDKEVRLPGYRKEASPFLPLIRNRTVKRRRR